MPPPAVGCFINFEMKQLVAGGGVALIGITLVPLLSGLLGRCSPLNPLAASRPGGGRGKGGA